MTETANNNSTVWYEELPDGCPPLDAAVCNGVYYRIANGNPAQTEDFFSQRKMQPTRTFADVDECVARSLSVFSTREAAELRLKLPKFRQAHIVEVVLTEADGKIKKTFGSDHYSWWRTKLFDVTKTSLIR